jgi:hypothetical protein
MRLVSRLAPPAAIVALALAVTAVPASAERNAAACSMARKDVAKYINEVTFFNGLANTLGLTLVPGAPQEAIDGADGARQLGNSANNVAGANC